MEGGALAVAVGSMVDEVGVGAVLEVGSADPVAPGVGVDGAAEHAASTNANAMEISPGARTPGCTT